MKRRLFFKCINRKKPYKHYPKYTSLVKCMTNFGSCTYVCGKLKVTVPDNLLNDCSLSYGFIH